MNNHTLWVFSSSLHLLNDLIVFSQCLMVNVKCIISLYVTLMCCIIYCIKLWTSTSKCRNARKPPSNYHYTKDRPGKHVSFADLRRNGNKNFQYKVTPYMHVLMTSNGLWVSAGNKQGTLIFKAVFVVCLLGMFTSI